MSRSEERLGTAPLVKLIFSLAIPAVLAQLVNLLYSVVDRIYIGHIPDVGALALTGMGLSTPIIMLVSAFAAFTANGGAPLAAIELGRGDRKRAGAILTNAAMLLLVFSVVLTVLLFFVKRPLLYFFGASDETIYYADSYLSIYLAGTVFVMFYMGLNTFISCQGKAKIAMLSVIIGAVSNIILDPIFIFALDMGVRGAAVATVISQALSAFWVLRFLLSEKSIIGIDFGNLRPDFAVIRKIASLGVSPFIMLITESLIAILFTNGLQRYGGDLYVGSYTILNSIMQMVFFPANSFAYGAQPITSYNYGAGNYSRVRKTFWIVSAVCLSYTTVFVALAIAFPHLFAEIFTSDAALAALCAEKLPIFICGMMIFALQMSTQASLLGIGHAKASLFLACLRKVILLTPLALILPVFLDVDGIYLAEPISDALSAITSLCIFVYVSRKVLGSHYELKTE